MRTDITVKEYDIHELAEYINWIYFFHAWGFQPKYSSIADIHGCDGCRAMWLVSFKEDERPKASEAMQLHKEAQRMLNSLDGRFKVYAMYRLMYANSDGDNLIMEGTRFPLLRQQSRIKDSDPFLCLSDFVRPASSGVTQWDALQPPLTRKWKRNLKAMTINSCYARLWLKDWPKRQQRRFMKQSENRSGDMLLTKI